METLKVPTQCPICRVIDTLEVDPVAYQHWRNGTLIQVAFPDMPAEKREQLITGTCPKCWEEMFAYDEEEEGGES